MENLCCLQIRGGPSSYSSGKGKNHEGDIKFGFDLVKGKANHPMEDYHVARFVEIADHELGLFAIYDGHSGDLVPSYLQKHLFDNILNESEFWVDPKRSISKAYEKTDAAILSHDSDLGRGGSTSVTAVLINGQRLWVANLGDSRAVISKGGEAIQLSTDHEPSTERVSIEHKGGFVSNMPGDVPRVNGQLAVSRAFGDKSLKSHLRSDPAIQDTLVDNKTDLLVLASDGLWKVMDNQEAIDIARKIKDPQRAAKRLVAEALKRDSKYDISCVVVRFRSRIWELNTWFDKWLTQKTKKMQVILSLKRMVSMKMILKMKMTTMMMMMVGKLKPHQRERGPAKVTTMSALWNSKIVL